MGDKVFKCRSLNTLGWVHGELYNLETAIRYNREGAEASYKVGDPEIIRNAEINLGDNYLLLGDLEEAPRPEADARPAVRSTYCVCLVNVERSTG